MVAIHGSDDWIERAIGTVSFVRNGLIVRVLGFFSWAEALKAAGLSE